MSYMHFFDDWNLLSRTNLVRKLGSPKYMPQATLEDEITEGTWNFPMVARIPEEKKYIALYGGAVTSPALADFNFGFKARTLALCYAESEDGIHWHRPDLTKKTTFGGERYAPNQVFGHENIFDGGPTFYDPLDPDRRFKLLYSHCKNLETMGCREMATSPDGINWKIEKTFLDQPGTDSPTSIFYNHLKDTYVFNVRAYGGDRRIFFQETKDFGTFTEPQLVMHPDPEDAPLVGFYGMPVMPYENMFVGLLMNIHCDPATKTLPNGPIDCSLTYSYDGRMFNRAFHKPFIKRNELGEHGGGCIYTSSMLVDENNNIRFYSGASKGEHFQNQDIADAALMLHTLRLDGFVYLTTHAGHGQLRTKPFITKGPNLKINARSPFGAIKVRVLDENAKVIPGFDLDDCQPLQGDELFWQPTWKDKTFSQAGIDQRRFLEFDIDSGEIYAIRGDFELLNSLWSKK